MTTNPATDAAREPLSRARVIAAALDLVDEHGAAKLSMRKLGALVGVEAMSLYNHVDSKEDLLDGVASLLLELVEVPDPPLPDLRAHAWAIADNVRKVGLGHPNAFPLLASRRLNSLDSWAPIVGAFDSFRRAGLDDEEAGHAVSAMASYIVGAVLMEIGRADEGGPNPDDIPEDRPLLRDYLRCRTDINPEDEYRRGIELLLDGVERRLNR